MKKSKCIFYANMEIMRVETESPLQKTDFIKMPLFF